MIDGLLDVFVVKHLGRADALVSLWRLYNGTLEGRPDVVRCLRARRVRAVSAERTPVGIEGEHAGYLPIVIEVVPVALPIVVGPGAAAL
jgi:diacylglycerol kinase family enzyme